MTDIVDTSAEAVERLAVVIAPLGKSSGAERWSAAATLRALAAERDAAVAARDAARDTADQCNAGWKGAADSAMKIMAERDRLAAENARLLERVKWLEEIREGAGRALCERDGIAPDELGSDGGHVAWQLHVYDTAHKALRDHAALAPEHPTTEVIAGSVGREKEGFPNG